MDGSQKNYRLVLIATTNRIDLIDDAFKRAGRFNVIEVPAPSKQDLYEIWQGQMRAINRKAEVSEVFSGTNDEVLNQLVDISYQMNFVGADVRAVLERAVENHLDDILNNEDSMSDSSMLNNIKVPPDALFHSLNTYQKYGKKTSKVGF